MTIVTYLIHNFSWWHAIFCFRSHSSCSQKEKEWLISEAKNKLQKSIFSFLSYFSLVQISPLHFTILLVVYLFLLPLFIVYVPSFCVDSIYCEVVLLCKEKVHQTPSETNKHPPPEMCCLSKRKLMLVMRTKRTNDKVKKKKKLQELCISCFTWKDSLSQNLFFPSPFRFLWYKLSRYKKQLR